MMKGIPSGPILSSTISKLLWAFPWLLQAYKFILQCLNMALLEKLPKTLHLMMAMGSALKHTSSARAQGASSAQPMSSWVHEPWARIFFFFLNFQIFLHIFTSPLARLVDLWTFGSWAHELLARARQAEPCSARGIRSRLARAWARHLSFNEPTSRLALLTSLPPPFKRNFFMENLSYGIIKFANG